METILGVQIPSHKRGEIALTYLYGIGKSLAKEILIKAKVDLNKKPNEWTEGEAKAIRKIISEDYKVEGNLRAETRLNIKRLQDNRCYRGQRHNMGLPVRGQNTRTNSRTRKGRGMPIANKKKAHQKT
jgi:small subunit ribosomal protein S13